MKVENLRIFLYFGYLLKNCCKNLAIIYIFFKIWQMGQNDKKYLPKRKTPVADVPYIGLQIIYTTNSLFM